MAALITKRLAGERELHDLPAFAEAVAGLRHRHPQRVVLELGRAAPHADVQRPLGQRAQHRHVLGEADGIVPRQHHHRRAEPKPGAGGCDMRHEHQRIRRWVVIREMMLYEPHRVVAEALGEPGIPDGFAIEHRITRALAIHGADLDRITCRLGHISPAFRDRFIPGWKASVDRRRGHPFPSCVRRV